MGIILPISPWGEKDLSTVPPFRPENNRTRSARENAPSKREGAESKPRLNACTVGKPKERFVVETSRASLNLPLPPSVMVEKSSDLLKNWYHSRLPPSGTHGHPVPGIAHKEHTARYPYV